MPFGEGKNGSWWANAMKRVAAGAHLPTPWIFEPAKHPDDRADNCLNCSFSMVHNSTTSRTKIRPLSMKGKTTECSELCIVIKRHYLNHGCVYLHKKPFFEVVLSPTQIDHIISRLVCPWRSCKYRRGMKKRIPTLKKLSGTDGILLHDLESLFNYSRTRIYRIIG